MSKFSPQLSARTPISAFNKTLQADWKGLFKALSTAVGHAGTGQWEEVGTDTAEALSSLGLATEAGELAFLLVRRALTKAIFALLQGNIRQQLTPRVDVDALIDELDFSNSLLDITLGPDFLEHPADLPVLEHLQSLLQDWLQAHALSAASASAISARLPSYFVYALNQEWRLDNKSYQPLLTALNTPFSRAGEQQWAWATYAALLKRRVQEGMFDEPFSLAQVYVPLNASYEDSPPNPLSSDSAYSTRPVTVVGLEDELLRWLDEPNPPLTMRVISGGPGSGKSSFLRIFAANVSERGEFKVLFVPLHLIDAGEDLVEEVGRFVRDEGVLMHNPLAPEFKEKNLLIIFDGLDELASLSQAAAQTARAFVRKVERTVDRRNVQGTRLRVLLSGRELVVQQNEEEFRRSHQILTLLPYYVAPPTTPSGQEQRSVDVDLRAVWWKNYGELTGRGYAGLPAELNRKDLTEITSQPLLNYLLALSFTRGQLNFDGAVNLNEIYGDLVAAVHERSYEKFRSHHAIRHMRLEDFVRMLEEVSLAAWHGDGRSTTVREIENYCRDSGLSKLFSVFNDGAEAGVIRLLAAFFFRKHGQRASGDATFIFTHKSFGEYLVARRIVRAIDRMVRELEGNRANPDQGWDERTALKHWATICGPSAVSSYLHPFLLNEIGLQAGAQVRKWQELLSQLFTYVLSRGMPMEQLQPMTFREMQLQARNAEEALFVVCGACARAISQRLAPILPWDAAFGTWFQRMRGQHGGSESPLAIAALTLLDLQGYPIDRVDFSDANLTRADLRWVNAEFSLFVKANLSFANMSKADFSSAQFDHALLDHANLAGAKLAGCNFRDAMLRGADLRGANLRGANLERAYLGDANLEGADLTNANVTHATFDLALLAGANLEGVALDRASFRGACLQGAMNVDARAFSLMKQ